jgi:hypothetical protein
VRVDNGTLLTRVDACWLQQAVCDGGGDGGDGQASTSQRCVVRGGVQSTAVCASNWSPMWGACGTLAWTGCLRSRTLWGHHTWEAPRGAQGDFSRALGPPLGPPVSPHQAHQGAGGKGYRQALVVMRPPPPVCSLQPLRCPAMRWGGARGIP